MTTQAQTTVAQPQQAALRWWQSKSSRTRIRKTTVTAILVLGLVPTLLPFYWTINTAFKTIDQIHTWPLVWFPNPISLDAFREMPTVFPFWWAFRNTMTIMIPNLIGSLLTSSMVAFAFARLHWPGRDKWFVVLLATMMIPWQVTVIPRYIVFTKLGWINTYVPLTIGAFFGGSAFHIFLLRQFFMTLPTDLEDAARIDGCGTWRLYWNIGVPHVWPALVTVSLQIFVGVWNNLLGPLLYLNDYKLFPIQLYISMLRPTGGMQVPPNLAMAVSAVTLIPILLVFFLGQKYFIQGVVISGVKG
jgi:ABC-type glycerol-3-phosphate transport system permease component